MNWTTSSYLDRFLLLCYHNPWLAAFAFLLLVEFAVAAVLFPYGWLLKFRAATRRKMK